MTQFFLALTIAMAFGTTCLAQRKPAKDTGSGSQLVIVIEQKNRNLPSQRVIQIAKDVLKKM